LSTPESLLCHRLCKKSHSVESNNIWGHCLEFVHVGVGVKNTGDLVHYASLIVIDLLHGLSTLNINGTDLCGPRYSIKHLASFRERSIQRTLFSLHLKQPSQPSPSIVRVYLRQLAVSSLPRGNSI